MVCFSRHPASRGVSEILPSPNHRQRERQTGAKGNIRKHEGQRAAQQ